MTAKERKTRIDVGGSCLQDVPTYFPLPEGLSALHDLEASSSSTSVLWQWSSVFLENEHLYRLFKHVRRVSALVDANVTLLPEKQRISQSVLNHRYISPLLYELLLGAQNDITKNDVVSIRYEAFRLAGILYLAEIRRTLGVFPVWSTVQIQKLETLLFKRQKQLVWEGLMVPKLWIMTFGAVEATTSEQRKQFKFEMKNTMDSLGLGSYSQLEATLKEFLLIDSIHGGKVENLYSSTLEDTCNT